MLISHNGETHTSFNCGKYCVDVNPLIFVSLLSLLLLVLHQLPFTEGLGLLPGPDHF